MGEARGDATDIRQQYATLGENQAGVLWYNKLK
jgi:hypothetical protein